MDSENPRPTKKRHLTGEERQRAIRACCECRRLKEKCEGGMPCKRCRHLGRSCSFNRVPPRDAQREPHTRRTIEELKDRATCMARILRHHFPNLGLDIETLRYTCDALPAQDGIDSDKPGLDLQSVAMNELASDSIGMENENCTIDCIDGTTVHYSGEFSHWNFSMHIKRNMDSLMASSPESSQPRKRVPEFIRVGEPEPGSTAIEDIVALLPPRPLTAFLVDVFFKHSTSYYYFVEKRWITDLLNKLHASPSRLSSKDVTATCMVLMVLAVGTQYVHLESTRKSCNEGAGTAAHNPPANWESDIGSTFYRQVARLLSEVIHAGTMLSVQVFMLLGLYSLPIDASGLGYMYLNLAIKVAIQNGMHRKDSRDVFDSSTKQIRRCIWWTAYCMERKIAIYHGRPTAISRSEVDADFPSSPDTSGSTDVDYDTTRLLESIHLTCQAEAFLHQMSRLRSCPRSEAHTILNRIRQMKQSLHGRWTPQQRHMPSSSTSSTRSDAPPVEGRANLHARLECCLLHMFIGRPFILAHHQRQAGTQCRHADAVEETLQPPVHSAHSQWDFLIQDSISAANEAIDICHLMRTSDIGLAKSSYAEYSSCRASLMVLIAHSICCRTNEHSEALRKGLDAIKEMASVGESARSEVSLLEDLEEALQSIHTPEKPEIIAETDHNSAQDGYEGLLKWYTNVARTSNPCGTTSMMDPVNSFNTRLPDSTTSRLRLYNQSSSSTNPENDYPFDLDLLNADGNMSFVTSGLYDFSNTENEFFENFLWPPS
ncbi:hypothetical protein HBI56_071890 [Parastagonospora nodorum]|nr:hypothetical protein HBH56_006340 [Parastagonospora nodorum]KAH3937873.1 hypothetical protein HBH54_006330 [Parastagonospora nodorum]KAH3975019.1 hypothetical protein HBH51_089050 [Parastagonospora nodorum]KAH3978467.1 hypothetical protein HBH52_103690 [Parastagonospora nodorum]KAH4001712.1 hypothetical protein HBI10_085380 [Parastagonospora nodorum]